LPATEIRPQIALATLALVLVLSIVAERAVQTEGVVPEAGHSV